MTSQPTITTTTNTEIQASLKSIQEQFEAAFNAQASVGVQIDPTVASTIQNQVELIRQQFDDSLRVGGDTSPMTNTEIQTSLKTVQEQFEAAFNAQASVVQIDPTVASTIQNQLDLIRQQFDDSLRVGGDTSPITNTEIQTSLKAVQEQFEAAFNAQASVGVQIDPVLASSIQTQLDLIRQQFDDSLRVSGDTSPMTNTDIQTQLKTIRDQLENQFNTQMSGGAQIDPTVASSIQNQLDLIRQQIDDSLRVGPSGDLTIPNAEVQAKLELEKNKIENSFNKIARRIFPKRRRYARLASAEINRIVEGNVVISDPYSPEPKFERKFKPDFNKRGESGAFAYAPRQLSARTPEWGRKMKLYMLRLKQKVKKSQWYVNAKDPWNNIDFEKTSGNAKMFALEFVDFFDEICDKISIAATFVDGFLYDPDGTGLDWYPLSDKALDQVAQESVKIQLDEFKIYNASLGPDEVKSSYPLVSGPLDILDADVTNFAVSSRNDPEYAQRRMEYEVDAVRKKILEDASKPYRKMIIDAGFNGDETELADYIAENPLNNSILDFDGLLSPTDYDALYVYAFTEVCSYHGGKTYVDTYTDADGIKDRKRPQCGWATKEACVQNAETWINSQGQFGTYGEWFTWSQLNTIFTNLKVADNSFEAPLTLESKLYPELSSKGMCIVTGAGQHFSCKDAGGIYDAEKHKCVFSNTICQYYGTCYDPVKENCFIPENLSHAQNFLGQSFPREWIRLHGCLDLDSNDTENFKKVMRDMGNFFSNSGLRMLDDMVKNKKNWNAGMKASFSDPDTIANLGMIILPRMLSLGTGPSMMAIAFVVGGMMAEAALSENRRAAQMPPAVPAEYTVGGWRSNHTDVPFKDRSNVTSIVVTTVSTQQGPLGLPVSTVYVVFTTDKPHGFSVGDKLYHQGLSNKIGKFIFYDASGQNSEFTISEIPTPTTIKISQVYSIGTASNIDPTDVYVYARSVPNTKTYDYTLQPTADKLKGLIGIPEVKIPISVGFVPGWVTKPLRPRRSDGTTLVSVTEGVDQIAGVVTQDFYIDVEPRTWSILPNGCSTTQYSENTITTSCVNKQYTENYRIAEKIDGKGLDAAQLYRCLAKGLTGWVWAFSDICKKATAVDAATGFIQNVGSSLPVSQGFEWQSLQKYKRLCSERDKYGVGPPMVRAWDAPHINTTWCIPETPPASWADDNIGKLNTTESIYARNRAWTGAEDESSPSVHTTVVEEGGNEQVGDSAKYWYYQLVYDPELFNRNALWNDTLLSQNFSAYTISEMRRYYCLNDFSTFYEAEPPTLDQLDDRCWGYMSIFTKNYSYTPMTNVGNIIS